MGLVEMEMELTASDWGMDDEDEANDACGVASTFVGRVWHLGDKPMEMECLFVSKPLVAVVVD